MTHLKPRPWGANPRPTGNGVHVGDGNGTENIYDLAPPQAALHVVVRLNCNIAVEATWTASGDRRGTVDFVWSHRPDPMPADVAASFDRAKAAILAAVGHINRALVGDA